MNNSPNNQVMTDTVPSYDELLYQYSSLEQKLSDLSTAFRSAQTRARYDDSVYYCIKLLLVLVYFVIIII